jgi:hypothetical protein
VLHDEPLTPYEAIQLDPAYLTLVSQALTHACKSVQRVGFQVLKEMSEDPHLAGRVLPDRLHILMRRMRDGEACPREETYPQAEGRADSEPGPADSEPGEKTPSSESENAFFGFRTGGQTRTGGPASESGGGEYSTYCTE